MYHVRLFACTVSHWFFYFRHHRVIQTKTPFQREHEVLYCHDQKNTYKHNLESIVNGNLALLGADFDGFSSHAKSFASLGVTNDGPDNAEGLELVGSGFSGESTAFRVNTTVLGTNGNIGSECCQQLRDVDVRDTKGDLDIGGNWSCLVEDSDTVGVFVPGTVALPVTTNQVLAGSISTNVRGRSRGARVLELTKLVLSKFDRSFAISFIL